MPQRKAKMATTGMTGMAGAELEGSPREQPHES
jgi:hypothetical protein